MVRSAGIVIGWIELFWLFGSTILNYDPQYQ